MLPHFEYLVPKTVSEACSLLVEHKGSHVLAGGTDLLVTIKEGSPAPTCVIDLKKIVGLDRIDYDEVNGLKIGPLATLRTIETSTVIREKYPPLYQAACVFASPQIRNRATIGGNICNAIPSADTSSPLIVLGATLKIMGPHGERRVSIEEFFKGVRKNALSVGEILAGIEVPPMPKLSGGAYLKHTPRRAMDLALVGVAVFLEEENGSGKCKNVRIALTSVAPTPIRARKAEEKLRGQDLSEETVSNASEEASKEINPRQGSKRSSPEYRREMVKVLVRRAVMGAWKRA